MALSDAIETDGYQLFVSTDDFGESVTYYPHRYYGEAARDNRTINAVVIRNEAQALTEDGMATILPVWEVHVANSSTLGIASDELDIGKDKIGFPPRHGETAVQKSIVRLTSHDNGMLVLECR